MQCKLGARLLGGHIGVDAQQRCPPAEGRLFVQTSESSKASSLRRRRACTCADLGVTLNSVHSIDLAYICKFMRAPTTSAQASEIKLQSHTVCSPAEIPERCRDLSTSPQSPLHNIPSGRSFQQWGSCLRNWKHSQRTGLCSPFYVDMHLIDLR